MTTTTTQTRKRYNLVLRFNRQMNSTVNYSLVSFQVAKRRSDNTIKGKVVQQETVTKKPKKEKDAHSKETGSKRRKPEEAQEVKAPQDKKKSTARRRKNSHAEAARGETSPFTN